MRYPLLWIVYFYLLSIFLLCFFLLLRHRSCLYNWMLSSSSCIANVMSFSLRHVLYMSYFVYSLYFYFAYCFFWWNKISFTFNMGRTYVNFGFTVWNYVKNKTFLIPNHNLLRFTLKVLKLTWILFFYATNNTKFYTEINQMSGSIYLTVCLFLIYSVSMYKWENFIIFNFAHLPL